MNTLLTVLIMCVIGFFAFIFFAETTRLKVRPTSQRLRSKHSMGRWVGALVALSSVAAFFVDGSLVEKLKPSLLLAAFAATAVALVFNFTPKGIAGRLREKREKLMYGDLHPAARSQSELQTTQHHSRAALSGQTGGSDANIGTADAGNAAISSARHGNATTAKDGGHDSDLHAAETTEVSNQKITQDRSESTNDASHPLSDVVLDNSTQHQSVEPINKNVLVDQERHEETGKPDIAGIFPGTGFVHTDQPAAANSGSFKNVITADPDEIVVDDFFEEVGDQDSITDFSPQPVDEPKVDQDALSTHGYPEDAQVDTLQPALETSVTDTVTMGESEADSLVLHEEHIARSGESDTLHEPGPDATEIDQLAYSMQTVNDEAAKLQQSVLQMHELTEHEQYLRTELNGARLAFEKAQEAQFESETTDLKNELKFGEKKLQTEQSNRLRLEQSLEDKRHALIQVELRVSELEGELKARQQVFHDQMESLKKTREMARNAALLARRAATMQQRAQTTALQERAARERLEVSAKKAVNIARNAISKLAEEERKNRSSHGLH